VGPYLSLESGKLAPLQISPGKTLTEVSARMGPNNTIETLQTCVLRVKQQFF
jgi:hypothetical protein